MSPEKGLGLGSIKNLWWALGFEFALLDIVFVQVFLFVWVMFFLTVGFVGVWFNGVWAKTEKLAGLMPKF